VVGQRQTGESAEADDTRQVSTQRHVDTNIYPASRSRRPAPSSATKCCLHRQEIGILHRPIANPGNSAPG
jgi:hypothetical protein